MSEKVAKFQENMICSKKIVSTVKTDDFIGHVLKIGSKSKLFSRYSPLRFTVIFEWE